MREIYYHVILLDALLAKKNLFTFIFRMLNVEIYYQQSNCVVVFLRFNVESLHDANKELKTKECTVYIEHAGGFIVGLILILSFVVAANLQKIQDNPELKNVTFALVSTAALHSSGKLLCGA
jgi:hypothetical protein